MQLLHTLYIYVYVFISEVLIQSRRSMTICRIHDCLENPDPGQSTGPVTVCRTQNEGFWLNESHHRFKSTFLIKIKRFLISPVAVHWLIASDWLWKVMGSVHSSNLRFQWIFWRYIYDTYHRNRELTSLKRTSSPGKIYLKIVSVARSYWGHTTVDF